jgi:hypothetical protein
MKYNYFDIFKGVKDKKGRIIKQRSVGHCLFNENNVVSSLQFNGQYRDRFHLEPEEDPNSPHDFLICYHRRQNPKMKESIGVATLLCGVNAGLIQLELDIYGNTDLYINLGCVEAEVLAA